MAKIEEKIFKIGSDVEVISNNFDYSGAWCEATIIAPPRFSSASRKRRRKMWGFWVKHKNLFDKDGREPLCEYIKKRTSLRPPQPRTVEDQRRCFQVNDVVDAFHLDGWWPGVVVFVVTVGEDCRFRVAFKDPDYELEFPRSALRIRLDWVDGNWVRSVGPQEKMASQLGSLSAAEDHCSKRASFSNDKEEFDESRSHVVQPMKKLKRSKHVKSLQSLVPNEGNLLSFKLSCKEIPCTSAPVDEVVVEAPDNQHSPRCSVSGKEVDSSKTRTKDRPYQGSLVVPEGAEKQVFGSTLHNKVNEQNATNGKNISAGVGATTVQSCVETSPHQPSGMLYASHSSMNTPVPSLPVRKYSKVWRAIESLEIFAKTPQNPHFSPLEDYEEEKREELALQKMIKYAVVAEKISKLTIDDLKTSTVINDVLASVKDLEVCGFDVMSILRCFNDLLLTNDSQTHLLNKLEEVEGRIRKCNLEKEKVEEEIHKTMIKMNVVENTKETMDQEIVALRSEERIVCDEIDSIQLEIDRIAA